MLSDSVWWLLLAVMTTLVVDAVRPLGPMTRLFFGCVILVLMALSILRSQIPRRLRFASPLRWARRLERDLHIPENALVNAWSLRPIAADGTTSLTTTLALRAAQRGDDLAARMGEQWRPDTARAQRSVGRLFAAIISCVIITAFWPRLVTMGTPRILDPFGDHPPYTHLDFTIETLPPADEVYLGDDVVVEVEIRGNKGPLQPDLMIADAHRVQAWDRKSMTTDSVTGRYRATLSDLDEPVIAFVQTSEGRSPRFELRPIAAPRVIDLRFEVDDPPYATDPRSTMIDWSGGPIEAPVDGAVRCTLTTSLPLQSASASNMERAITFEITHGAASGTIPVSSPGVTNWLLDATAEVSGLRLASPIEVVVDGQVDSPPTLELSHPPRMAAAVAGQPVMIRGVVRDDLGVVEVLMDWKINRGGRMVAIGTEAIVDEARLGRSIDLRTPVRPSAHGAAPGDILSFVIRATDGRPLALGGPQSVESEPFLIQVLDPDLYAAWSEARGLAAEATPLEAGSNSGFDADSIEAEPVTLGDSSEASSDPTPELADGQPGESAAPAEDPEAFESLDEFARREALFGPATPSGRVPGGSAGETRDDDSVGSPSDEVENPEFAGRTSVIRRQDEETDGDRTAVDAAGAAVEAPSRYRELVRRYFEHLAKEEDANP